MEYPRGVNYLGFQRETWPRDTNLSYLLGVDSNTQSLAEMSHGECRMRQAEGIDQPCFILVKLQRISWLCCRPPKKP